MPSSQGPFRAKHCFWRTAEGRPYRGSDGKFAPDAILAAWGTKTQVDANGETYQQGFSGLRLETALKLAFVVTDRDGVELDQEDAWSIARTALRREAVRLGGGKPITAMDFIRQAETLAEEFYAEPEEEFVFVTSLSVGKLPTNSIKIGGATLRGLEHRNKYRLPRIVTSGQAPTIYQKHIHATRYKWVAVTTTGRTTNDAFNRAYDAVTLLRALWTFAGTFGSARLHFGIRTALPLAAVHQGPIQTLHHRDGEPVSDDFFWRDADPQSDRELFTPSMGWEKLEQSRRQLMRRIARLPYREDIEQMFQRYITSLDHRNHDIVVLQLWSLLERVTNLVGARYDDLVERTSWIMPDRRLWKQLVACVRLQRNRYVHSSQPAPEAEQVAYLTKSVIEAHLLELIGNRMKVTSLQEYAEMLALPTDAATLRRRRKQLSNALRFHSGRREDAEPTAMNSA